MSIRLNNGVTNQLVDPTLGYKRPRHEFSHNSFKSNNTDIFRRGSNFNGIGIAKDNKLFECINQNEKERKGSNQ